MNIAFNINKLAMIGLGVTLNSLIFNCSNPQKLKFYFLCAGLSNEDKNNIKLLLEKKGLNDATIIDFNPEEHFGHLKSLHGDYTAYGRLLLQDLIQEDSVLYLDADLVVELDVLDIEHFSFEGKALAAVNGGEIKYTLENGFFCTQLGLSPNLSSFNSGILYINLKMWREKDIKNQCLVFGKKHSNELKAADQTILNALFAGNFACLPVEFNCAWYAKDQRPNVVKAAILHFVGSPKPWDVFGRFIHNGHSVWESYLDKEWRAAYYKATLDDFARAWRLRRSYLRTIKNKIK
jgi:lipopolysaccharide biosynthesis glycosyltransferase